MARIDVLNAHEVRIIMSVEGGEILNQTLSDLYFVAKYSGEENFLTVNIPETLDEQGLSQPAIRYHIRIVEDGK